MAHAFIVSGNDWKGKPFVVGLGEEFIVKKGLCRLTLSFCERDHSKEGLLYTSSRESVASSPYSQKIVII